MDNFNLQGYIASGKLHNNSKTLTEAKKQGYDDREDESLGARRGAEKGKKQSMKARRDDSYGKFGKRDAEKKGKNKINKEGKMLKEDYTNREVFQAISDIADAITNLRKLGNEAYGGEKKNVYSSEAGDAFKAFDKAFADLDNNLQSVDVKLSEGAELNEMGDATVDAAAGGLENIVNFIAKTIKKSKEWVKKNVDLGSMEQAIAEGAELNEMGDATVDAAAGGLENIVDFIAKTIKKSKEWVEKNVDLGSMQQAMAEGAVTEDARTDAEEEGYKDGMKDEKADMKKMKVSELKAKIKEQILSELTLSEADEEVDVDIDVEDEVEVEAGADDIEIERPGVKTKIDVGLTPEEEVVQDSLKAAMDAAQALGSDKLADQIGNTITFFTRQFVVGDNTD